MNLKLTHEILEQLRAASAQDHSKIALSAESPCICGNLLKIVDYERKWHSGRFYEGKQISPGINYTDLLCEDCRTEFKDMPRIVCLGCRRLMGFIKPGKQATGFEFVRGRHYHIISCPRCDPKNPCTPVIEHEKFCKEHGIKTSTNQDLLQEIEQKILQAEQEAARLRAEFQASKRK